MKKFKAYCYLMDKTFETESHQEILTAVVVRYQDQDGEESIVVEWGQGTFRNTMENLFSKIGAKGPHDESVRMLALCEVMSESEYTKEIVDCGDRFC